MVLFILSLQLEGKNPRNLLNTQENAAFQLQILNCIGESFPECGKIIISSPNCFYVKLCSCGEGK